MYAEQFLIPNFVTEEYKRLAGSIEALLPIQKFQQFALKTQKENNEIKISETRDGIKITHMSHII